MTVLVMEYAQWMNGTNRKALLRLRSCSRLAFPPFCSNGPHHRLGRVGEWVGGVASLMASDSRIAGPDRLIDETRGDWTESGKEVKMSGQRVTDTLLKGVVGRGGGTHTDLLIGWMAGGGRDGSECPTFCLRQGLGP